MSSDIPDFIRGDFGQSRERRQRNLRALNAFTDQNQPVIFVFIDTPITSLPTKKTWSCHWRWPTPGLLPARRPNVRPPYRPSNEICRRRPLALVPSRSEEHTSELQ